MIPPAILAGLREHQRQPAQHLYEILSAPKSSAVDLSTTGYGKTYVAAAVAVSLGLPTLVICPKIACSIWKDTAAQFGDSLSVVGYELLRAGNTLFGTWDNPRPPEKQVRFRCKLCQCYITEESSPCYCREDGVHQTEEKKKAWRYGQFTFHPNIGLIIADEVHRASGFSLNADMLTAAKRQGKRVLGLTATAACSPLQMYALGYVLGLHSLDHDELNGPKRVLPNFYRWAAHYKVRRDAAFRGLHWFAGEDEQNRIMREIRSQIIPMKGVRVTEDQIPNFPARHISVDLMDLGCEEEINALYLQVQEALDALKLRQKSDKDPDSPLTKILRAHQRIELLKIPGMLEVAADYKAKGHSVGFFVNYTATLEELRKKLKTDCVIFGEQSEAERQRNIGRFQDHSSRDIIVNIRAGGACISLQDKSGDHPRAGIVSPPWSAVDFQQLVGRFQRDGGRSDCFYRVMLAAGSIETKIHRALKGKLNNLDALNDGDLNPCNL